MKSLGKMVVIAQGIFDLRVLYQEKIRFEKCAQKVGILKFFFHKLVSYVPNMILFHCGKYGPLHYPLAGNTTYIHNSFVVVGVKQKNKYEICIKHILQLI